MKKHFLLPKFPFHPFRHFVNVIPHCSHVDPSADRLVFQNIGCQPIGHQARELRFHIQQLRSRPLFQLLSQPTLVHFDALATGDSAQG